jgi:DNA invertase Pin-like site-specific DNA recombinase
MKIGYARVSTDEQNLALQMDALEAEGCERVYKDTASGTRANRKGLADAVTSCAAGDVLTVWKLDRLGRSLSDLVKLAETLKEREIGLKVLAGAGTAIDTTNAQGRFVFGVVAAVAEFERELIVERVTAGMKAARRRGQHLGRPRKLPPERLDVAADLLASGKSWRQVARALSVSTSTLRDGLKRRVAELQKEKPDRTGRGAGPQTDLISYLALLDGGQANGG